MLREEAAVEARERSTRRALLAVAGLGLALLTAALGFVIGQAILRGRAARALAENERRLQLVVDAMHDGLTFSDERGRFTIWNPAMEALTGYSLAEANASDDLVGRLYPEPGERARALEGVVQVKESGRTVLREAVLTAKTGERRELLVSSSLVRRGDQLGFLSTYHDVTSPRQAEREREKLIHQLQSALADVKTLRGLLPICGWCKKVRDDQGYYHRIEAYISAHSEARFTHGICPDCIRQFEGELARGDG